MSQSIRKPVALALGAALVGGMALSPSAFAMTDLAAGYMLGASEHHAGEGKCGEGKCGEGGGEPGHTFVNMDTDKDGAISKVEFAAAHDGDDSRFARYDADENGSISQAELDAGHEKKAAAAKSEFEGKCGVKCGEGKCGEGQCGCDPTKVKAADGKTPTEGKCGEGKCGEGKCGEGKCGEGKCGGAA